MKASGFSSRARASLAAALVFVLLNSSLGVVAQVGAGESSEGVQKSTGRYFAAPSSVYVIEDENGETTCRVAPPEEALALRADTSAVELHQINHLDEVGPDGSYSPDAATVNAEAAGMRIILRGTQQLEQNPTAKAAFIAAAARWEALIKNPITIVIDVDFGPTHFGKAFSSSNFIGTTGTQSLYSNGNYSDVRQRLISLASSPEELSLYNALPLNSVPTDIGNISTVAMQTPLMRALGALPPVYNADNETRFGPPPQIGFNSALPFDFNPEDGITDDRMDFDAVAVHEIGHVLGFGSMVGERELSPSQPLMVAVWDLFRFRPGVTTSTFTNAQRILSAGTSTTDPHVHFDGGAALQLSTGRANQTGGDKEQASHWKDDRFVPFIGIMDPSLSRNRREQLTANDRRAVDFFGFQLQSVPAPANDNFASASSLSGASGTTSGNNNGATKEANEPNHAANVGGNSVWYRWTAPAAGSVTFDTVTSSFDTTLAAYTGQSVNALSLITQNDDIVPEQNTDSRVTFNVAAGSTYNIAVDGFNGSSKGYIGSYTLNWSFTAAPPPSTFQFTSAATTVPEFHSGVSLFVTRSGDLSRAQTVFYTTSDGTAAGNSDYGTKQGSLVFAPGDDSESLSIFMVNDTLVEPDETFSVTLSGPTDGATLGSPSTAVVTIVSDDVAVLPNTVQFATSDATVTEGVNPAVNVTVTRTGNTVGAASVAYATSNATATDRGDYLAAYGTLNFAPNQTSQTFSIFITDDAFGNTGGVGDVSLETFNVRLTNPVGCTLGSPDLMQVRINNNETADGPNPVDGPTFNSEFFVRQHYRDFLGRDPDAGGLAHWRDQIESCGADAACREVRRINVSAAFFLSIEFQETGYLVYRTYGAALGTRRVGFMVPLRLQEMQPDTRAIGSGVAVGIGNWTQQLEANKVAYFNEFVTRPAFTALYPATMPHAQFVDTLNNADHAAGALSQAERDALVAGLNNATLTRAQVLRAVAEDADFHAQEKNRAFVLMQYFGYLRRNPDDAPNADFGGYYFWLQKLDLFGGNFVNAQMVKAFLDSFEYHERFGR